MENSSRKPKKPLKPARKFKDADAFLDAVTPTLIENLERAEAAKRQKAKKDRSESDDSRNTHD